MIKRLVSQLGKNKRLKTDENFLGRTEEVRYERFDLPQGLTCPGSTEICEEKCYQKSVENRMKAGNRDSAVLCARKLNWLASLQEDFVQRMVAEIKALRPKRNQKICVRIHASGDFYSKEYMEKWFVISLAIKLYERDYTFTAYTKSFDILDRLLSNQDKLKELKKKAYDIAKKEYREEHESALKPEDFNIHIIGSVMEVKDDVDGTKGTREEDIKIIEKYGLPRYTVTTEKEADLVECEKNEKGKIICAECSKCYTYPMTDVRTRLR